ncbi:gliding motility-associated C-terminal domain-containing protein [Chitinophagaceae bacterium MMS25-I14]
MKHTLRILSIFLIFFTCYNHADASHCAGGEIVYKHVPGTPDSVYHITFKLYRDCAGTANAPSTVQLCGVNTCNNSAVTAILQPLTTLPDGTTNGSQVLVGCSGYPTRCQSTASTLPGYEEWWYQGDVTLPSRCSQWEFSVSISARNGSANLDNGSTSDDFFIKATLNNAVAQGNSSPLFTVKPVPYVCINNPYSFNNGATDPDGDSLTYQLQNPLKGACGDAGTNIAYTGGASTIYNTTTNPIACNNTFVINPVTGQMNFTPSLSGKFTMSLLVKEYRNHVLIGSSVRDVQVIVLPNCSSVQPAISLDTAAITGGQWVNGRLENCANTPINFCIHVTSPLPNAVLVVSDNHAGVTPAATMTYTGELTNSVQGCYLWTPGNNDTGLKNFNIIVKDSTCLPPGLLTVQTFSIPIYVHPVTNIYRDTTICSGDSVMLQASGGGTFTWSVLPGGAPLSSLSCISCNNTMAHPPVTTSYVVSSNLISACNKNKDTVTITVVPIPSPPVASSNSPICINDSLKLDAGVSASNYVWTGPAGFQSSIRNPVLAHPQLPNTGTYQVRTKNGGCISAPSTISVTIIAGPAAPVITGNNPVCEGQTAHINASSSGAAAYHWTLPGNLTDTTQNLTIANAGTQHAGVYSVISYSAASPHCASPVSNYTLTVNPKVTADFTLSRTTICQDDTVLIAYTGVAPSTATYTWNFSDGSVESGSGKGPYVVRYPTAGNQVIHLVASNLNCSDSIDKHLNVLETPLSDFQIQPDACIGQLISLQAGFDVPNGLTYNWNFDGATVLDGSGKGAYKLYYTQPGIKRITLSTQGAICHSVLTADSIFVHPPPEAHILPLSKTEICSGDTIQVSAVANTGNSYHWSPVRYFPDSATATTDAHVFFSGYLSLTVADSYGCAASDSVYLSATPCCDVALPNAFTPNGDGKNDQFRVITIGHHAIADFRIVNRWGQTVFETLDEAHGWDGTFGGAQAEAGTYFYYLKYKCINGQYYEKHGDILLVR